MSSAQKSSALRDAFLAPSGEKTALAARRMSGAESIHHHVVNDCDEFREALNPSLRAGAGNIGGLFQTRIHVAQRRESEQVHVGRAIDAEHEHQFPQRTEQAY
jgi:hypothetical protein